MLEEQPKTQNFKIMEDIRTAIGQPNKTFKNVLVTQKFSGTKNC